MGLIVGELGDGDELRPEGVGGGRHVGFGVPFEFREEVEKSLEDSGVSVEVETKVGEND